jgi:hypothetical protein
VTPPTWLDARPPANFAGLLDVRPRGRADALSRRRSPPTRLGAAADIANPRLVRVLYRVPAGARGRRVVATDPDLGPQPYGDSAPAPRATRSVLGGRPVILRLTPKTAAPVGECVTEWHFLEKQDERDGGQRGAS